MKAAVLRGIHDLRLEELPDPRPADNEGGAAIRGTGYDEAWAIEMISDYYWEWDPFILAWEAKARAEALLAAC